MRTRILGVLAALLLCGTMPANAVIVEVDGEQWHVATATGTFTSLSSQLQSQTWWADFERAKSFATALGNGLGYPNDVASAVRNGPLFAWVEISPSQVDTRTLYQQFGLGGATLSVDASWTWAVATRATSVPEPSGLALFLALGGVALGARVVRRGLARPDAG
jgi:hypothetical protein